MTVAPCQSSSLQQLANHRGEAGTAKRLTESEPTPPRRSSQNRVFQPSFKPPDRGLGKVTRDRGGNMSKENTSGVLFIHSAPTALIPHIEWAVGKALAGTVLLKWEDQIISPGTKRTEFAWRGPVGSASELASALRGWHYIRFEITESATAKSDGARFMGTPSLGIHHSIIGVCGDTLINEDRIRTAIRKSAKQGTELEEELDQLLGRAWDLELEPFRFAGDKSLVRWCS